MNADEVKALSAERKATPIASGVLFYFPDALAEVARLSKAGNDKHNPGEPLHWSRGKSNDHADCVARHLIDAGPDQCALDEEDGFLHATKTAWRALANLQVVLEKTRGTGAAPSASTAELHGEKVVMPPARPWTGGHPEAAK